MIVRTDTEVREEFKRLFKPHYGNQVEVSIYHGNDYTSVDVSADSEMTLSLKKLIRLSEFFGTTNIDEETQHSSGGCDTCDYGATYTLKFTIRPDVDDDEVKW